MATRPEKRARDDVDRADAAVKRAVTRLAKLLGDPDDSVVYKAALSIGAIGAYAIGPLETVLVQAASPRHRGAIVGALLTLGADDPNRAILALIRGLKRETVPEVSLRMRGAILLLSARPPARKQTAG